VIAPLDAVDALEAALLAGLDPEAGVPRSSVPVPGAGEILLMPGVAGDAVGVKLVSIAPGNPAAGQPRIQGVHVVFDPRTLAPVAVLDGAELSAVRTAAVSALAIRHLAAPDARELVVFGTGPQAAAHVRAMRAVRPGISSVAVVGRDPERLAAFVAATPDAAAATPDAVAGADVVCCCTTARTPLFDGALVRDGAVVVAVGSHEPTAREVDAALVRRATVVVEARGAALAEAGDLILAGRTDPAGLHTLAELVRGTVPLDPGRPRLFKSVGMAWEDAVVGAAVAAAQERPKTQRGRDQACQRSSSSKPNAR
jgi:ornithine cyclodeaminase/alanine dehydrogenase-like protein (mu-crystallin family)